MTLRSRIESARRRPLVADGVGAVLAAGIACAYAAVLYRVWEIRWDMPIYAAGIDNRGASALVKNIVEHGWWLENPSVNAPFHQELHDFPAAGESLQLLAMKLMGYLLPSYGHVMNVYYLAGFGVIAGIAFLAMRQLRFGPWIGLVVALTFTFLPYHFQHSQEQITRSSYFWVPLACLLLLWTLSWRTSFLADPEPPPGARRRDNLRRSRVAFAVLLAAMIAATETMNTAFTMTLLASSAVIGAIRWREPQRLVIAGSLIAVMLVVFVAVNAPTLAYWAEHGQNAVALDRPPGDSEKFGLKISRLVLPDEFHRVGFLGDIGEEGQRGSPVGSEPGQALGILGTIGFFTGVLAIFLHGLRRRGSRDLRPAHDREALIDHGGLLILLATLFGVIAGFSVVIAVSGFGEVRVWNRIMLTIAFLSLVLTAIWLERGAALLRRRLGRPAFALGIATAVLLAVALLDGRAPFPDNGFREWYVRSTEAAWVSDTRFVRGIENRMPDGAAIFQLPVRPFPEAPNLNAMEDYDLFRGYLHDDGTLRWSYGGMKGRPEADWQQRVKDPARQLPALVGMGFAGLYVDTAGLGADAPGYLAGLADVVGPAALTSENGRLVFFDLRAYADDLPQSDDALRRLATREFGIAPPESAQSGG